MDQRKRDQEKESGAQERAKQTAELRRSVGRRIARARMRAGWKQADLAEAIEGTVRMVSRYETGRTLPRLKALIAIARALGVSLDFLAALVDDPLQPADARQRARGARP